MALTKPNWYLVVVSLVIIVFGGLAYVGTSLLNNGRTLNNDSLDYLLEIKGVNDDSGFTEALNRSSGETQNIDPLGGNISVSDSQDFLSAFYIKKERASQYKKLRCKD